MLASRLSPHTKRLWVSNPALSIGILELMADDDILESFNDALSLGNLGPLYGNPDVWVAGNPVWGNEVPALAGRLTSLLPGKLDSQPLSCDRQAHWSVLVT